MRYINYLTAFLFIVYLLLISTPNLLAQQLNMEGWQLYQNDNNLKIYTRPNPDSGIKEVRITTTMKTSISGLVAALNDVSAYTDWVYKCSQPKKLKVNNPQDYYYYTVSDLPFPVSDRDLVVHSKQWKDTQTGIVYSHSIAVADFIPEKEGIVRIKNFESYWMISPNSDGTVSIDYQAKTDHGGNIPVWIINMGIASGPVKTMENLAEIVQLPKYQNAKKLAHLD